MITPQPWELDDRWAVLSPSERELVSSRIILTRYSKNAIIHHQGDHPTYAMILVSGKAKITRMGNSCRPQILRLLRPGDTFGYRAAISGDTYNATVCAVETCSVICIPVDLFLQLLHTNANFAFNILRLTAHDLANSEQQTLALTQKRVRGRLADTLLNLADVYGYREDGKTIDASVTREDLACMSNMITANAIRTLSAFASEGIVAVDGRTITILDVNALHHLSLHD